MRFGTLASIFLPLTLTGASPLGERAQISVQLDLATIIGSSAAGVDSFKGIPFAQPPVGQLRLKPPKPITSSLGTIPFNPLPRSCPQFITSVNTSSLPQNVVGELLNTGFAQAVQDSGEDCLTLNVQRPSSATTNSSLPVIFWIYGGGFEFGSTQTYDGTSLVATSIAQKQDIIYVSANYRLGGFGFLPGKEILADGSANLGLLDQRLALQWVADNIAKFGGDPTKVTIWGESAGSISVFDQMALYNGNNLYKGKPLFRAGIMDSGSIIPTNPVDTPRAQQVFDTVVQNAGCSAAANKLDCLRSLDYSTYLNAANSVPSITSYSGVALSYLPRPDGKILTQSPELLAMHGNYAKVPFIVGDQEDEGTLFSLAQNNISTTADLVNYLSTVVFQSATTAQVAGLVSLYPDDPSAGSPFRTGVLNNIYPQYKRLAALQGDFVFTITRRIFLNLIAASAPNLPTYSYLASYFYGTPVLGTFHASDILPAYGITPGIPSTTIQSYYISFINSLNPNSNVAATLGLPTWPQWGSGKQLMNFNAIGNTLLADDFRSAAASYLGSNTGSFRI